jgi:hypothetical protein
MDPKVFLPILADSTFAELNLRALNTASRINEIVVLAMLAPSINKKTSITKIFSWIAVLITVYSLIIICQTLAGLGLDVPKKTFDPYYLFIKQIDIYDFITRIEFFMVGAWNVGMFLKISILLYLTSICLAQIFGLANRNVLILPLVAAVFILAMTTDILKSVVVFDIMEYLPYINLLFMSGIPLLLLAALFLKKSLQPKSG